MKTLEEASLEHAKNVHPNAKQLEYTQGYESFKAGIEFIQKWISVEEESPPKNQPIIVRYFANRVNIDCMLLVEFSNLYKKYKVIECNNHFCIPEENINYWKPIYLK